MDVARARPRRRLRASFLVVGGAALVVAGAVTAGAHARPRAQSVRRSTIWTGDVERGAFVIRVKGAGTLLPEAVRWLTAESSGRVEEVFLKPGAAVEATTPVVRLENLDTRLQAVQAEHDVASARTELLALARHVQEH